MVYLSPLSWLVILNSFPGGGKNEVEKAFVEKHDFVSVSTGDILRCPQHEDPEMERVVAPCRPFVRTGDLVPTNLFIPVWNRSVASVKKKKGIVLNGYPRDPQQAEILCDSLDDFGDDRSIFLVTLDVSEQEAIRRMGLRPRDDAQYGKKRVELHKANAVPAMEIVAKHPRVISVGPVRTDYRGELLPEQAIAQVVADVFRLIGLPFLAPVH